MKKNVLWTSVAFTIAAIINMIVFITLFALNVVESEWVKIVFAFVHLVLVWLPVLLTFVFKFKINLVFLTFYQIFIFLGLCVGYMWGVYAMGEWFDKIVHTLAGLLLALLGYTFFENTINQKLNLFWVFVLIFSFSMMCAGMWEILEYAIDGIFGANEQRFEGFVGRDALRDTMYDLICNFAGAVAGGMIAVWLEKIKSKQKDQSIKNENSRIVKALERADENSKEEDNLSEQNK